MLFIKYKIANVTKYALVIPMKTTLNLGILEICTLYSSTNKK